MSTSLNTLDTPIRRTRNIDEILKRPRLQEALRLKELEQKGEYLPEQGKISDVDREIYSSEGLDYNLAKETKSKITTLETLISSYKAIQSVFQVNTNEKIEKMQREIETLKASIT